MVKTSSERQGSVCSVSAEGVHNHGCLWVKEPGPGPKPLSLLKKMSPGLLLGLSGEESARQCGRHGFREDPHGSGKLSLAAITGLCSRAPKPRLLSPRPRALALQQEKAIAMSSPRTATREEKARQQRRARAAKPSQTNRRRAHTYHLLPDPGHTAGW